MHLGYRPITQTNVMMLAKKLVRFDPRYRKDLRLQEKLYGHEEKWTDFEQPNGYCWAWSTLTIYEKKLKRTVAKAAAFYGVKSSMLFVDLVYAKTKYRSEYRFLKEVIRTAAMAQYIVSNNKRYSSQGFLDDKAWSGPGQLDWYDAPKFKVVDGDILRISE